MDNNVLVKCSEGGPSCLRNQGHRRKGPWGWGLYGREAGFCSGMSADSSLTPEKSGHLRSSWHPLHSHIIGAGHSHLPH